MMPWVFYVSWIATSCTFLFFLTGIFTCMKIIKANSTENVSHLPFLISAFCCFMWVMYGIPKKDSTIIFVNAIGMAVQSSYLICYFIYSKFEPVFKHTVYIVLLTLTILTYLNGRTSSEDEFIYKMGISCDVITVVMFASPLVMLAKIFRTRSTATLSFPLTLMTIVNSSSWTCYGYLINDAFVITPNFLGLILGLVQASLFCIFPSKPRPVVSSL